MADMLKDLERLLLFKLLTLLERGHDKGRAAVDALNLEAIQDRQCQAIFQAMQDIPPTDWNPAMLTPSAVRRKIFGSTKEGYTFLVSLMHDPDGVKGYGGSTLMANVRQINAEFYDREHIIALKAAALSAEKKEDASIHLDRAELMAEKRHAENNAESFSLSAAAMDFIDGVDTGKVGEFGMDTGMMALNNATNGFKPGQLITVGAPTGGGKSVFAMQMALMALEQNRKVLYVSLEMSKDELIHRMLSSISGITLDRTTNRRKWDANTKAELQAAAQTLTDGIEIIDSKRSDITLQEIRAVVARGKYDMVVVDYLQLLSFEGPKDTSREQQVASMSRTLKKIASRYDCIVMAPIQLNEDGKARESRAVTNDSDLFLTIDPVSKGHQIRIRKQRSGRTGDKIPVIFQSWISRIVEEKENVLTIYNGNCLDILPTLEEESVHCCVTSPPYWGLRDYGGHQFTCPELLLAFNSALPMYRSSE